MNPSRFFFFLSLIFFAFFLLVFYQQNNPQNITFANSAKVLSSNTINETTAPTGIIIPSIHVWLPVYNASVTNGNWETTNKGVSFLSGSATVGGVGNAIFYGHDWPNLLGNLKNVLPGDTIQIISKTGEEFFYEVSTVQEVTPADVSVLAQTVDSRVTIYTCSGFLDSKRLVVVALLKKITDTL